MYKCKKCGAVFNRTDIFMDRYYPNLVTGVSGKHCPSCKSDNVATYDGKYCGCCGMAIEEWRDFCSAECEETAKLLRRREERRKKLIRGFEISAAVREVEAYNREHGTKFSYGEYFSRKGQGMLQ